MSEEANNEPSSSISNNEDKQLEESGITMVDVLQV